MKENRGFIDEVLPNMFSNPKYSSTYLFYAHMITKCSIKIDRTLPAPAGVAFVIDHYNLYINPEEFDKFTLEEALGVLKHEMLHILNNHVQRMEDLSPSKVPVRTKINEILETKNSEYIEDLKTKTFKNMKEMYHYIKK